MIDSGRLPPSVGIRTIGSDDVAWTASIDSERDRQVHPRPLCVVAAGLVNELRDQRMLSALGVGRVAVDDVDSLAIQMCDRSFATCRT